MHAPIKKALITGITGQDGSYLAEFLLAKGYEVHGVIRNSTYDSSNIHAFKDRLKLHLASLDNHLSLYKLIAQVVPSECYHLAAPGFVSHSLDDELAAFSAGFSGTHALLANLKELAPNCRFYFAGSSEMFGRCESSPQNESTPFQPRSIYGIAKVASYHLLRNYREKYGLHASCGITYNHESPRRGFEYVTRKITCGVAKIKLGKETKLIMGSLDPQRDWGYAPDYIEAMWLMLQQSSPNDLVLATGKLRTVRDFVKTAFECVDLDYEKYVQFDDRFFRAPEKIPLCGDASRARSLLNWKPKKDFNQMVQEMVESDLKLA